MLANPFKTRIIAETQVKTDKIDARILALLLRAGLASAKIEAALLLRAAAHQIRFPVPMRYKRATTRTAWTRWTRPLPTRMRRRCGRREV